MELKLPFIGMGRELRRLSEAFRTNDPLLLLGPRGSGKTRLIQEALRGNGQVLYVAWEPTLRALLTAVARALIEARHEAFLRRAKPGADPEAWLAAQTSIRLKGLLWSAIESSPVPMVLDGVAGAGFPTYRFVQRIYHVDDGALFVASRDSSRLGALARLFWNPAKAMHMPVLVDGEAQQLFESAARHFGLYNFKLDDFREKVLESAGGNPGQIIEMCRLAADPQYHAGRHIKFSPLRIDTLIRFTP